MKEREAVYNNEDALLNFLGKLLVLLFCLPDEIAKMAKRTRQKEAIIRF